jgi:UDPglucose 6-dehydrogenase
MKIAVFGLWHLGCVTAACLAEAGHDVHALDFDTAVVAAFNAGHAPLAEPGLDALLQAGLAAGRLRATTHPAEALADADVLWVAIDTPVDEHDRADVGAVRATLERLRSELRPDLLVLISSQVPAGFTRALEADWHACGARFAVVPENLRLGKALDTFRQAERTVVGLGDERDRARLEALLGPFCQRLEWMSIESAEFAKHAVNAFLAVSVAFINELARLAEGLGADAQALERALKSEPRIGPRAYLGPGGAFAGGTLARDLRYLTGFGQQLAVPTPLIDGALESNARHARWMLARVQALLGDAPRPVVALLGLTYKPGTDTLRRSAALELAAALVARGAALRAHDPALRSLPPGTPAMHLCASAREALAGAELAVLSTAWPEYATLRGADFVDTMTRARVVDPGWFLAHALGSDARIEYVAPGRAPRHTRDGSTT